MQSDFEYLYNTKSLLLYNNWKKYQSFLKDYTDYILEPKIIIRKRTQTISFKSDKDKVLHDLVKKLPTLTGGKQLYSYNLYLNSFKLYYNIYRTKKLLTVRNIIMS